MTLTASSIRQHRIDQPRKRARDLAQELGISEAELVAADCGQGATRLRPEWDELLPALGNLGEVMALTRNQWAVIEKDGRFRNIEIHPHAGNVLDDGIDLRFFLSHWTRAFAVHDPSSEHKSIQVFDRGGTAVLKVYLRERSDRDAFDALVERFAHADQATLEIVEPYAPTPSEKPDADIDVATLRQRWSQMKDTHEFFMITRELGLSRMQALRLGGPEFARQVDRACLEPVLTEAARTELPIMVFVGNRGNIEIHTGPVRKVKRMGDWMNVLDPGFNLHVDERGIHSAWVVRKPTTDGDVTSLELYSESGENIALLFGRRKPGHAELPAWRELVNGLK